MTRRVTEASYPIEFRAGDARKVGRSLAHHDSVVLIGAKRVGISNFLRFFLYHEAIASTYIKNSTPHVFVTVDLNDLVERNIVPFGPSSSPGSSTVSSALPCRKPSSASAEDCLSKAFS